MIDRPADRQADRPPAPLADRAPAGRDQPALDAYARTVLEFPGPPSFRIDLRQPLPGHAREALAVLGLDGPFAILTAENPEGEHAEDAGSGAQARAQAHENRWRMRTLEAALDRAGAEWVPVTGRSPAGDHEEHCVAVRLSLPQAQRLAESERQVALFWFDGAAFWLMPAEADATPRRLPELATTAGGVRIPDTSPS